MEKTPVEKKKDELIDKMFPNSNGNNTDDVNFQNIISGIVDEKITDMNNESALELMNLMIFMSEKLSKKLDEDDTTVWEVNGVDYVVMLELEVKEQQYYLLINIQDPLDFIIRKEMREGDELYIMPLDSDDEYEIVWAYIIKEICK